MFDLFVSVSPPTDLFLYPGLEMTDYILSIFGLSAGSEALRIDQVILGVG